MACLLKFNPPNEACEAIKANVEGTVILEAGFGGDRGVNQDHKEILWERRI